MNVASLELCRELYELSGWDGYFHARWYDGKYKHYPEGSHKGDSIPAYDLGYVLRKLPDYVKLFRNNEGVYYAAAVTGTFRHPANQIGEPDTAHDWYTADTPEDAVVKLAIELFKQNILTKEN